MVSEDDVAGLLAAEDEVAPFELVEDVAVADRDFDEADLVAFEAFAQPEVGHHRGDDSPVAQTVSLGEIQSADREDLVAVDQRSAFVDRDDPIGITVKGQAGPCPGGDHRFLQLGGVG